MRAFKNQVSPPNYFDADPSGLPSQQLLMNFEKTVASALDLHFATDLDAVLAPASKENLHTVTIADYDHRASFPVACGTLAEGEIIEVELISPRGERITPANAASFGLTYRRAALSRTYSASAVVLRNAGGAARYGQWTIVVSRGSRGVSSVPG